MSQTVSDWLPLGAVVRDPVRTRFARVVEAWSSTWFCRRNVALADYRWAARASDAPGVWRRHGPVVAIACAERLAGRLRADALGVRPDQTSATDDDRRVLDAFQHSLLHDLVARLSDLLGHASGKNDAPEAGAPFDGRGGVVLDLADDQGFNLLSAAIPAGAMVRLCRSTLAPLPRRPLLPAPISRTLSGLGMPITADLGQVALSLEDLQGLAPGDVLVLDHRLDQPLNLRRTGSDVVFARARLAADGPRLSLTLQAS
ncbi:MAG: FliM/FliN family flagellar motor C-terminal domain-containing protein [Caulobacteraceae bacterium]|nr:FliM/FliN family flagellar motor C-terminal domain-containing protein [Caulobacteraceae bacterium]